MEIYIGYLFINYYTDTSKTVVIHYKDWSTVVNHGDAVSECKEEAGHIMMIKTQQQALLLKQKIDEYQSVAGGKCTRIVKQEFE